MDRTSSLMNTTSLYDILKVERNANDEDIKKAYRTLALQYHPDKNPSPEANEKIRELNYAHSILQDPKKRKIYDQYGNLGLNMMNQIGEENMSIFLISQNRFFKFGVIAVFLLSCCCYGCFCCFMCCCNFCCGKCVPAEVKEEYDEVFEEANKKNDNQNAEEEHSNAQVPNEGSAIPLH